MGIQYFNKIGGLLKSFLKREKKEKKEKKEKTASVIRKVFICRE